MHIFVQMTYQRLNRV